MLTYSWIKFIHVPLLMLYVVIHAEKSTTEDLHLKGSIHVVLSVGRVLYTPVYNTQQRDLIPFEQTLR
jgi:hypothetical protein